jgi:predicted dehydrogenase
VTVRGCNMVMELHKQHPKQVLSVAEQFRRDPICRLMKALLEAGAIGAPQAFFALSASSSDKIIIFPWRHLKNIGGILTDAGVHTVDLMQYWMGPVREIYAQARLMEPIRYKSTATTATSPFYEHWTGEIPDQMEATAEDTLLSVLTFESGAVGQWTSFNAAHGEGFGQTVAYGAKGSLRTHGARDGRPLALRVDGLGDVQGDAILDLVPDFHLNAITAALFGSERLASYPFVFPEADRKLVAVEYQEMGECILKGNKPEVDAATGRSALAVCHAALEASVLNRPVTVAEVIAEKTGVYEEDINTYWKV